MPVDCTDWIGKIITNVGGSVVRWFRTKGEAMLTTFLEQARREADYTRAIADSLAQLRESSILSDAIVLAADDELEVIFEDRARELDDAVWASGEKYARLGYHKPIEFVVRLDVTACPDWERGYEDGVLMGRMDYGNGLAVVRMRKRGGVEVVRGRVIVTMQAEVE